VYQVEKNIRASADGFAVNDGPALASVLSDGSYAQALDEADEE
jgi:hypothetical protein